MQKAVRRLIVGYDGSEHAQPRTKAACDLVQPDGVVTVVNAYDVPWQAEVYPGSKTSRMSAETWPKRRSSPQKSCVSEYPASTTFKTAVGKPAEVLAQLAQSEDADLIVVGTRGLGTVRAAIGSVTYRLLHSARCPVLVIT